MELNDDFLIVEDDELFLGDENLQLSNNNDDNDDEDKKKTQPKTNNDNMLIVDDEEEQDEKEENEDDGYQLEDDDDNKIETKKSKKQTTNSNKQYNIGNNDDNNDDQDEGTKDNNPYSAWGQSLAEKGFFPDIDEEALGSIDNEDDISDLLEKQLNTTFNQWKDAYTNNLVNNLIIDGYIKKSDVPNLISQSYTEDDIKNDPEVAKNVIRKYYKRTNVPDKEIERIIASRDDLEESALELNKLNKEFDEREQETAAQKIKDREIDQQRKAEEFNKNVQANAFSFDEFIPGRKLKKRDKEDAIRNFQVTLQKVNSNLPKYGIILSYLDRYGLLDGDFSKIIKDRSSQTVKNDFQRIMEKKRATSGGGQRRKSSNIQIDDSNVRSIYK